MKAKLCLKNLFIVSTLILIAFAASSCTVNADPPVYYTITAAGEIENGTVSVDKTSATSGETVKITATADNTYELSALSVTDENGNKIPVTDGSFTMPEGNVVVSATFASILHNICIAQDIENGTVSVDKESAAQGETITVTAEPDEGYLLTSIHVIDSNGNEITVTENTFTMPKAHVTVSATFGVTYEIKIAETIENGIVSTSKTSTTAGETIQIETTPLEGYELNSLTVTDAEGNEIAVTDKTFTMPESAVTISAAFTLINYRLSIADGIQHGSVSLEKTTATMGETVSITVNAAAGYQLENLRAENSNGTTVEITDNTFVMPASDVGISAEFSAILYSVNIAGGISHGSVSADTATAIIGQSVTIMPKPDAGYKLTSLSVTDEKGKPIATSGNTFTMPSSSVTISAEFIAIIYSVNTSFNSDRGSISLDKTSAIIGETVSISTTPAKDYVLDAISVTDSEGNNVAVTENSFTMPASSVTVSATFLFFRLKTGSEINSILLELGGKTTATQFLPSETPPSAGETVYLISTDESEIPAYVWRNNRTINYYAPTKQLIPLNPDSSKLFKDCQYLKTIDLREFDTSNVTDMSHMFDQCMGLTSLDLSGFDTSNVTDMSHMFYWCWGLTSLDLSGFDTSSVTDMNNMFYDCSRLTSLDLSSFDTSSVTDMNSMFWYCSRLTSLDLSSFDTSSVTSMKMMFDSCSNLTSLDLSGFDTSSVTDMPAMFSGCSSLTSLDLSSFDTSGVTNMQMMFMSCSNLTSLDLSSFDTTSVTSMSGMFYKCSLLTSLDLSSFDTSSVTYMGQMFWDCSKLTTIYVSSAFNTNSVSVTSSMNMFYECEKLKGSEGTTYNYQKTDKTYARIDGGTSAPGLFTEKK